MRQGQTPLLLEYQYHGGIRSEAPPVVLRSVRLATQCGRTTPLGAAADPSDFAKRAFDFVLPKQSPICTAAAPPVPLHAAPCSRVSPYVAEHWYAPVRVCELPVSNKCFASESHRRSTSSDSSATATVTPSVPVPLRNLEEEPENLVPRQVWPLVKVRELLV